MNGDVRRNLGTSLNPRCRSHPIRLPRWDFSEVGWYFGIKWGSQEDVPPGRLYCLRSHRSQHWAIHVCLYQENSKGWDFPVWLAAAVL